MSVKSPLIVTMISAVTSASKTLLRDFDEVLYLQSSSSDKIKSFASAAFSKSLSGIKSVLRGYNKNYPFIMHTEDLVNHCTGSDYRWVIYPIYPLSDFSNGLYDFSACVVLMYGSMPISAVVHFPLLCETFFTERGRGSYIEGANHQIMKLRVSNKQSISECIAVLNRLKVGKITNSAFRVRILESYMSAAAYTAAGRYDIFIGFELNDVERAIVKFIVSESSGLCVIQNDNIIASNSEIIASVTGHE